MGAGLKAVGAGTKAATKLKSKDWKRLFSDLTDRVEEMSGALQEILKEQRERLPEVREKAAAVAEVAREKAGVVKPGSVVVAEEEPVEALEVISARCEEVGARLVEAATARFDDWGTQHAGLFTFAQSAKHVGLYQKHGYWARFLTAIMSAPVRHNQTEPVRWSRYSDLTAECSVENLGRAT